MAGRTYSLKTILSCTDQLSPALKKVRSQIYSVDRVFSKVTSAASSLAVKLAAPLTALSGMGLFSIQNAVKTYADLGGAIDDAAMRAGVASTALQSLRFAAQMGGMQAEQMDTALGKLTQRMGMAAAGKNKDLVDLFKSLGISLKDSEGNVRSASEVMRELAEAIRLNENASDRLRILSTAFGDNMAQVLVPVLQDGAAGLDAMAEKARAMGLVFSKEEIQNAAAFGDTLDIFNQVVRSVSFSIGGKLAPVLTRVLEQIQKVIIANRELITQRVEKIVSDLSEAISRVDFGKLINGFFDFIEKVDEAIDSVGGLKNIFIALGVAMGASVLTNVVSLASGILNMIPAVTRLAKAVYGLLGPWGLLAGALATLLISNWDSVVQFWEDLKKTISGIYDWIVEKIEAFHTKLPDWIFTIREDGQIVNGETVAGDSQMLYQTPILGQTSRVDGTVNIRVSTDEGSKATVESVESEDGTLNVEKEGRYSFVDA